MTFHSQAGHGLLTNDPRLRLYIKGGDFSASSFTSIETGHDLASTYVVNHQEELSFCRPGSGLQGAPL
jgi:hypothetical protein